MSRIVFDRLSQVIPTGNTAVGYLYTLPGNQFGGTVQSDVAVSFWFEYGRATDDPTNLPFTSGTIAVPAGESRGLIVDILAATQIARIVISNTSGGDATVVADFGSK